MALVVDVKSPEPAAAAPAPSPTSHQRRAARASKLNEIILEPAPAEASKLSEIILESSPDDLPSTYAAVKGRFGENTKPLHRAKLRPEQLTDRELRARSWKRHLRTLFPIAEWLPRYGHSCSLYDGCASKGCEKPIRDSLRRDVITGIVIGIMLIPQGMAYGLLAGLPPKFGLYGSIYPQLMYTIFGTCKLLGPGVNAPISLLVANSLATLPNNGSDCSMGFPNMADGRFNQDCQNFIDASMLLGLLVSALYCIMAVFRLGIVTAFMPEPALSGFTTGAAAVIITSQFKHFVG